MSLSGIISGTCAVLTGTSAFSDGNGGNISWMNPRIIETTGCRWAMMITLETADPTRMAYGQTNSGEHAWGLTLKGWVNHDKTAFTTWQADNKTFPQDVIDAISTCDTLSGSCEDASIELLSMEAVEVSGRRLAEYTFALEATEWDK